jgi:hypothetical protein
LPFSQDPLHTDEKTVQQTNSTVFATGLKVLSPPPLLTVAARLELSAKDNLPNKNFYKAL